MIKILIVEDQTMLQEMLADVLNAQPEMSVVATASDASRALNLVEAYHVDLVLMDVCTENDSNGIVAAGHIKAAYPEVKCIIMTGMPELSFIEQARKANVDSFVYKNISVESLVGVIRSTMEGLSTMPGRSVEAFYGAKDLTETEMAVLRQVCMNRSRKEIAEVLYMSEGTVKNHISSILAKTGYDSILRLAVHVVSKGNIVPQMDFEYRDSDDNRSQF